MRPMPQSQTPFIHILPEELLIYIFRLSTHRPLYNRYRPRPPYYVRFQKDYMGFSQCYDVNEADGLTIEERFLLLDTKLALPEVCRLWRDLALTIAHDKIFIPPWRHVFSLQEAVHKSELASPGCGFGRHIQHIDLHTTEPTAAVVHRQEMSPLTMHLPLVQRLDWVHKRFPSHAGTTPVFQRYRQRLGLDPKQKLLPANLTFFPDLLANLSTSLVYLSISINSDNIPMSAPSFCPVAGHFQRAVSLPVLKILQVYQTGIGLRRMIEKWDLPALSHIITDTSLVQGTISPLFSPQIKVIELWSDNGWYEEPLDVFTPCPNLREFNYFPRFFCQVQLPRWKSHAVIESIRLHADDIGMIQGPGEWINIRTIFSMIAQPSVFPSLRRVVCHGDWTMEAPLEPEVLIDFCNQIRRRIELEDEHGTPFPSEDVMWNWRKVVT